MMDFYRSLNIETKLSPRKNTEIIWFYIFFPALVAYLYILGGVINTKPENGWINVFDSTAASTIFDIKYSRVELVSDGLVSTNGPLYIVNEDSSESYLLFTDTELNNIYKWEEGRGWFTVGRTRYIENSDSGAINRSSSSVGSGSLLRKDETSTDIIVCQLGQGSIELFMENGTKTPLVTHYKGQRLNGPRDAVWSPEGHLYFTDLRRASSSNGGGGVTDESFVSHSGIYMIPAQSVDYAIASGQTSGDVILLDKSMSSPSGLAFSPDFGKLYVSNDEVDVQQAYWKAFDVSDNGALLRGKVLVNASSLASTLGAERATYDQQQCVLRGDSAGGATAANSPVCIPSGIERGTPTSLKVDIHGNLFATGSGGVLVLSPEGALVAHVHIANATASNVALTGDGYLYITAGGLVSRVYTKSKPARIISGYKR